ncbi:hypothetical protein [Nostoc sp. 'Peltigera membranacea cyanobiont' N6]|uniref:hypothetical protein n=1 Tax=Nostoc sp. 'Peltigera membranacea cyanobiont' N6 TaxID=1261031 RepID=UPI0011B0821F|nr:hypothetical protein [Nostoc sp. 'Peltigera membranacea cyanobiont' N6]
MSCTKTGDTAYQATCTTSDASTVVRRPAGNFLLSAISIPGCVPLAFSGCASASVAPQAVTLDCAVKVQIVQTLYCVRVQAVCFPLSHVL